VEGKGREGRGKGKGRKGRRGILPIVEAGSAHGGGGGMEKGKESILGWGIQALRFCTVSTVRMRMMMIMMTGNDDSYPEGQCRERSVDAGHSMVVLSRVPFDCGTRVRHFSSAGTTVGGTTVG